MYRSFDDPGSMKIVLVISTNIKKRVQMIMFGIISANYSLDSSNRGRSYNSPFLVTKDFLERKRQLDVTPPGSLK